MKYKKLKSFVEKRIYIAKLRERGSFSNREQVNFHSRVASLKNTPRNNLAKFFDTADRFAARGPRCPYF